MDLKLWVKKNPDRVGAWIAVVLGAVVLWRGWEGVSTTEFPAEQLPYIISGGIGGALLVALGATLLLSADLRDGWRKLDRIERQLAAVDEETTTTSAEEVSAPAPTLSDDRSIEERPRRRVLTSGTSQR
jgi:sulfite exporter TauE/SafE